MTINNKQLFLICLFLVCSACSGRLFRPSSGAHNCIYSFRYFPVPSHPRYQPAAISVENSSSCKYSYVLLTMGERVARNMYSRLEINKSKIVASYWSSFITILAMHRHMNVKLVTIVAVQRREKYIRSTWEASRIVKDKSNKQMKESFKISPLELKRNDK
jgi:hypothetical protein